MLYTRSDASAGATQLWSVDLAGSADQLLLSCPNNCQITWMTTAPGAGLLAYRATYQDRPTEIRLYDLATQADRLLLAAADDVSDLRFAPDGSRLAYLRSRETGAVLDYERSIWLVDVADGATHAVVSWDRTVGLPLWLDNDHVVFTRAPHPLLVGDIVALPVANPDEQAVLFSGATLLDTAPDGHALLVRLESTGDAVATDQTFAHGLVALTGDAPELTQTWQLPMGFLRWSPDSAQLAHTSIGGDLRLIDAADGTVALLRRFQAGLKAGPTTHVDWSPTGASLVYELGAPPGAAALYRLDLGTDTELLLSEFPWFASALFVVVR